MEIKINKIEQLTGKDSGNPYWRLETDKGNMSCFDKEIADKLWEAWQQKIIVFVDATQSKDKKYVNIRKIMTPQENEDFEEASRNYEATRDKPIAGIDEHGFIKPQDLGKPDLGTQPIYKPGLTMPTEAFNPTSMYVSYAKDIFCVAAAKLGIAFKAGETDQGDVVKNLMAQCINLVKQAHREFS